jgi:hypothetical protein
MRFLSSANHHDLAKRKELLALLRKGLRTRQLTFPRVNGAAEWPEVRLAKKVALAAVA